VVNYTCNYNRRRGITNDFSNCPSLCKGNHVSQGHYLMVITHQNWNSIHKTLFKHGNLWHKVCIHYYYHFVLDRPKSIHTFIFLSFYMDRAQWKGENINFIVDFTAFEHVFDFFDHVMQDWRDAWTNFMLINVKSLEISWSIMRYWITLIIHGMFKTYTVKGNKQIQCLTWNH
jgi:hypothetical protein